MTIKEFIEATVRMSFWFLLQIMLNQFLIRFFMYIYEYLYFLNIVMCLLHCHFFQACKLSTSCTLECAFEFWIQDKLRELAVALLPTADQ